MRPVLTPQQHQRAVPLQSVRMEQLLFALAAVVLVPLCRGDYTQFCHGQPCPEYTVLETNEKFEKRSYVATTWVSTPVDGKDGSHLIDAVNRLKAFWDKQKNAGIKMPDSWPALITQRTSGNSDVLSLSWFLPPGLEVQVSDSSVTLEHRDAAIVYVRHFDGKPSLSSAQENADSLRKDLTEAGKTFDSQTFTGAFYESYFSLTHNNEMWFYGN